MELPSPNVREQGAVLYRVMYAWQPLCVYAIPCSNNAATIPHYINHVTEYTKGSEKTPKLSLSDMHSIANRAVRAPKCVNVTFLFVETKAGGQAGFSSLSSQKYLTGITGTGARSDQGAEVTPAWHHTGASVTKMRRYMHNISVYSH